MTVPVLVLMLAAMVTAMAVSLRDHAGYAAAVDLAELRAEHAVDAFVAGCLTHAGCAPPAGDDMEACAAADVGVIISAQASWDPALWKGLTPVAAERILAYDQGLGAQLKARASSALDAC